MVDVGTGIIAGSIISLAGMIFLYILSNNNWFKRENFKIQKSNIMSENRLKLKKLAKQLDVELGAAPKEDKSLIDSLKDLDIDKIKDLLGYVQKEEEEVEQEEEENIINSAIKEIVKNPELRQKGLELLNKVTGKEEDNRFIR